MEDANIRARTRARLSTLLGLGLLLSPLLAAAQDAQPGKYPWEEYDKRLQGGMDVTALSDDLLGDSVNLSNGALSFSATDVSLESHHAIPLGVSRKYTVKNRYQYQNDALFADWEMDLPTISGVFATQWEMTSVASSAGARCSATTKAQATPKVPYNDVLQPEDVWAGNTLNLPGAGSGELLLIASGTQRPSSGGPYYWMTNDQVFVSCLPSISNGTGEGFLAVTPDGTRYWFNWMAQYVEPQIKHPSYPSMRVDRRLNVLHATRVEDRFGNTVVYTYDNAANAPARLQKVVASDGRQISFTYNTRGQVASATAGTRTWQYQYRTSAGKVSLSAVIQPDGSQWSIDFSGLSGAEYRPLLAAQGEPARSCFSDFADLVGSVTASGRIQHPSGAEGVFTVAVQEHGRSNVPVACSGEISGTPYPSAGQVNQWVISYKAYTLQEKSISGPGISPMTWQYAYGGITSYQFYPGGTMARPCPGNGVVCGAPICTSDTCAGRTNTLVTGPGGEWTRYIHGNSFKYDEGKLLRTERGKGSQTLHVTENRYVLSAAGQAFPARYGTTAQNGDDHFVSEAVRPDLSVTIQVDGESYTRKTNTFDALARPLSVTRSSSLGDTRTDVTQYYDNLALWVLGQPSQVTNTNVNTVVSRTTFDTRALPVELYSYGRLLQRYAFNVDGSLSSITDGNNRATGLEDWKRGVARTIRFPDGTAVSRGVDDNGFITSVTDETGASTNYDYDAMGRIARVRYPTADTVSWADTVRTFTKSTASAYGLPAGHWRQDVSTGSARKRTYYDAFWRPVLVHEFDGTSTATTTATQRFVRSSYDPQGRLEFQAYPSAASNATTGVWTTYDGLGRPVAASQDSESGLLTTTTSFLAGGMVRVTDPLGRSTTTAYQAFDAPSQEQPIAISHPEGVYTEIVRDLFGNPRSIKRRNASSTETLTRSYVYNSNYQLCKSIEPETGSTLVGYDAAGNVVWSAAGLALPSTTACDAGSSTVAARRVNRTYDARNRLATLRFPDRDGDQDWVYHADGKPAQITTINDKGAASAVNTYAYNKRRLLTGESMEESAGGTLTLGYGYDVNGALAGITYPSGTFVSYAPNGLGQPTRAGAHATAVSYYPNGGMRTFTYGNGIVHSMQQNARQLPARVTNSHGVLDNAYRYDGAGNVSAIDDGLDAGRNRVMQYDQLDRLRQATSAAFGGNGVMRYTYDALDNLRSSTLSGVKDHQYWYDARNRLSNVQTTAGATTIGLDYDVQGNLRSRNGVLHTFDFGNRLRTVSGAESYRYDAHGRRVLSTATSDGSRIHSFYGNDGVLRRQRNERTGRTSEYVHLNGSLLAEDVTYTAPGIPALTAPAASETGSYSVSWTAVTNANNYELRERLGSGAWATVRTGSGQSWSASNKAAGVYGYAVRACLQAACSGWSGTKNVSVQAAPTGVATLTVPATSYTGSYSVSWTAVDGSTRYELESSTGTTWANVVSANVRTHAISGQGAGQVRYRVRGCSARGCAAYSEIASILVTLKPAAAPTLTVPASNSSGAYTVSWTAVSASTSYALEQRVGTGAWSQIASVTTTSRAISGRASGSDGYRVRACNDAGCSAYSSIATVTVLRIPTGVPAISGNATQNGGTVALSWTAVTDGATYRLEELPPGGAWAQVQQTAARTASLTGRAAGTHTYRVRACNASGCGGVSANKTVSVVRAPSSAPALSFSTTGLVDGYSFRVQWGTVASASSYRLEEQYAGGAWSQVLDGTATSFLGGNRGLGTYAYRIRACNAAGCSGYSATASTTLSTPPAPPVPANLIVFKEASSCAASWGSVAGAASYELRNGGGTIYQGAGTSFSQTSPRTCVPPYQVRACSSGGCSAWSPEVYPDGGVISRMPASTDVEGGGE